MQVKVTLSGAISAPFMVNVTFKDDSEYLMDKVETFDVRKTASGFELDLHKNTDGALKAGKVKLPYTTDGGVVIKYNPHVKFAQRKWLGKKFADARSVETVRVIRSTATCTTVAVDFAPVALSRKIGRPLGSTNVAKPTAKPASATSTISSALVKALMSDGGVITSWDGARAVTIEHNQIVYKIV